MQSFSAHQTHRQALHGPASPALPVLGGRRGVRALAATRDRVDVSQQLKNVGNLPGMKNISANLMKDLDKEVDTTRLRDAKVRFVWLQEVGLEPHEVDFQGGPCTLMKPAWCGDAGPVLCGTDCAPRPIHPAPPHIFPSPLTTTSCLASTPHTTTHLNAMPQRTQP